MEQSARRDGGGRAAALALLLLFALATVGGGGALAAPPEDRLRAAFPGADRFGPAEGTPPAHPAHRGDALLGYVLSTKEVAAGGSASYGARPLDVLVGLATDCRIVGAVLLEQHEPILMIGVPEGALAAFVRQYVGLDVSRRVRIGATAAPGDATVDAISRATISSFALHDAILGAARAVARARALPCAVGASATTGPRLDLDTFQPEGWEELRAAGSIAQMRVTAGEAAEALRRAGVPQPAAAALPPEANFATLYAALATPPQIGANLLGRAEHARLLADAAPGTNLVFVGGDGFHSFKGVAWRRTGTFERIQIVQGERTIPLTAAQHRPAERLRAAGAPELRETAIFVLPPETGFAPEHPWRLELAVSERRPEGGPAFAVFALPYTLPERHLIRPPPPAAAPMEEAEEAVPAWQRVWEARSGRIAVLVLALLGLYGVFALQDQVARRGRLWRGIRLGAMVFTLGWLGWYAGAQLSVVNVLTFFEALRTRFDWGSFLIDPLTFILWSWVAIGLAFWGRGVFCGWLCPFGALQELVNHGARRLRVPQIRVPWGLHERLWPVKYVVFFVLFGISLGSMAAAFAAAEVEPFKTTIILRFLRDWPFVLYAVALLVGGLFIERFFCRYLCPLGGALALPARLRMFIWLKRHRECGTECQICATRCPVQAIHPNGEINPNECIQCLKCQTLYFDEQTCPSLIAKRQRREARAARRSGTAAAGAPTNVITTGDVRTP